MKYRNQIVRYFDKGISNKKDLLLIPLQKKGILNKNAIRLKELLTFKSGDVPDHQEKEKIEIFLNSYSGSNLICQELSKFLHEKLSDDLVGAIVLGSLANGDEINYSDFDGLVIIKDEVFVDAGRMACVAAKLIESKKIIYTFDPLQHHGWFILTEYDLENYPEIYFPHELFAQAKSFNKKGLKLKINIPVQAQDYCRQFENLAERILDKIKFKTSRNMYQLKGILSECMLLPALYIQCRTGKGIFKKLSFAAAKADFSPEVWSIMDEISEIRTNWTVSFNWLQHFLLTSINPLLRELGKKIAPRIPEPLRSKLDNSFYKRVDKLVHAMRSKVKSENQIF